MKQRYLFPSDYMADPSANVFNSRLYIYPSHDWESSPTLMLFQSLLTGLKYLSYNLSNTHVITKFCMQNYTKPL